MCVWWRRNHLHNTRRNQYWISVLLSVISKVQCTITSQQEGCLLCRDLSAWSLDVLPRRAPAERWSQFPRGFTTIKKLEGFLYDKLQLNASARVGASPSTLCIPEGAQDSAEPVWPSQHHGQRQHSSSAALCATVSCTVCVMQLGHSCFDC